MKVEIEGLDLLLNLSGQTGEVEAGRTPSDTILLTELFDEPFMQRHTNVRSIERFFSQSPWSPREEEDFDTIPEEELNAYVVKNTRFTSWQEMICRALKEYLEAFWEGDPVKQSDRHSGSQ